MGVSGDSVDDVAQSVRDNRWVERAIQFGMAAYGLIYLLVGVLAVQLALGDPSGKVETTGALHQLAEQPFGQVMLAAVAVGLVVLVLWRALQTIAGHEDADGGVEGWGKRAGSAFKGILYAALAIAAWQVLIGSGGGGGGKKSTEDTITATLMGWPFGPWLVGAVGLAIIGYGGKQIWMAFNEKFLKYLESEGKTGDTGTAYLALGKVGYTAKGVSYGGVGALFVWAALTHSARKSGGLDQALSKLLEQPFGAIMVGAVGLGLGCYGLFCLARARHLAG